MSVIIRLQNLPWSANASDIREFFKGLSVPEGGVHIVGGEMGDAFIAFATDEDARIAMMKTGDLLKGVQVTLHLSSRTQMQKVIETARQQVTGAQVFAATPAPEPAVAYQQPTQPSAPTTQGQNPFNPIPNAPIIQTPNLVQQGMNPIMNSGRAPNNFSNSPAMPVYGQEEVQQNAFSRSFPGQIQQQQQFPGNQPFFAGQMPPQQNVPRDPTLQKPMQQMSGQMQPFYDAQTIPPNKQLPMPTAVNNGDSAGSSPQVINVASPDAKERRESPSREKRRDSRDDRRRRTRSRSKSRDRRRRYRSRSRSRSRDRNGRRRRSRSHERNSNRDRRDRPRNYRDKTDNEGGSNSRSFSSNDINGGSEGNNKTGVGIFSKSESSSPRSGGSRWGPRPNENLKNAPSRPMDRGNMQSSNPSYRSNQDRPTPQNPQPSFQERESGAGMFRSGQWQRDQDPFNNKPSDGPNGPQNRSQLDSGNNGPWNSDKRPSTFPEFNRDEPPSRPQGDQPFEPMPPMGSRGMPFDSRRGRGMGPGNYEGGPGRGFARGRGRGFVGPDGIREKKKSCSIEILQVPPAASYNAIRSIFDGIFMGPNSIKIIGDQFGNPIGVALARFGSTRDTHEAFKRSGSYIFNSSIQINFIDDAIFDNAVDKNMPRNRPNGPPHTGPQEMSGLPPTTCILITGLPIGCTEQDVSQIFNDVDISDIVLERNNNGKPTGACIVKLFNPEQVSHSLNRLVNITMDQQSLILQACPEHRYQSFLAASRNVKNPMAGNDQSQHQNMSEQRPTPKPENLGADLLTDSIHVKNVSKDVSEAEVRKFLENLSTEKVFIKSDSGSTNQVYVTFSKISDTTEAMKKSNQVLGKSAVQIELISKPDVMKVMGLPFNPLELFNKSKANKDIVGAAVPHSNENKSSSTPNQGPINNAGSEPKDHLNPGPNGPFNAGSNGKPPLSNGPSRYAPVPSRSMVPDNFGMPGCVVALGNVPYTATTEDILRFFHEFEGLTADCVIRRYDELNRPTADACVALSTPQLAKKAVHILNRRFMFNRPINVAAVE